LELALLRANLQLAAQGSIMPIAAPANPPASAAPSLSVPSSLAQAAPARDSTALVVPTDASLVKRALNKIGLG